MAIPFLLDTYGNTIYNLTQWDVNQKLIVSVDQTVTIAPKVHFCNQKSEKALVVESTLSDNKIVADIPNILLQEPYRITAYVYLETDIENSSWKTIQTIEIPVRKRPKPDDYEYVENVHVIYLSEMIKTVERLEQDVRNAEFVRVSNENTRIETANKAVSDANNATVRANNASDRANDLINDLEQYGAVKVSDTEPESENVDVWIDDSERDEYTLPEINDSEESEVDTWSSKKIAGELDKEKKDIAELKGDIGSIAKRHINILENLQFFSGEYYGYESHDVLENADFGIFDLFNVKANEIYYFKNIFSNFSCVKYADGSFSRIENTTSGFASGIFVPTQDGVVAITGANSSSYKNTLFTLSEEMYNNNIYESYLSFSEKASDEVRKIIKGYTPKTYYVEKDGSGDFTKLSDAIVEATKYMDSVVYLGDGTWDLIEEFGSDFFNNATGGGAPRSPARGLLLKNRIHIIGSSKSKIICNYTGDNAVIKKWFSVFNADIYGFTLENITIEASNIRYIIHDERDSDTDSYINRYINCHCKFDNSDNTTPNRTAQCIGGGLGLDGYIDMNGCVFESIDTTNTGHICVVSYHNSAGANAKNHISIKNTYLKGFGYIRINSYGESTEITECEITNCSMGRSVLIGHETGGSNMNINVTQWNNEIR